MILSKLLVGALGEIQRGNDRTCNLFFPVILDLANCWIARYVNVAIKLVRGLITRCFPVPPVLCQSVLSLGIVVVWWTFLGIATAFLVRR